MVAFTKDGNEKIINITNEKMGGGGEDGEQCIYMTCNRGTYLVKSQCTPDATHFGMQPQRQ
jgi:hypothetical protein